MRWTPALLLFPLLTGCPKKSGGDSLVGTWLDESGTRYTIGGAGNNLQVTSAIDDDGEIFQVTSSGYRNGHFTWSYFVPSTDYNVTMEVLRVRGNVAECAWSNDHAASGTEDMTRQ